MPVTEKKYPDWVQKYRTRGKTVKKKGDAYYLYKRTSKRVPGKKYPQPVDTYIGIITPDGVVESDKKKISLTDIEVWEYGFSKAILDLCPEGWKRFGEPGKTYSLSDLDEETDQETVLYKERWFKENGIEQRMIVTYSLKYRDYLRSLRQRHIDRAVKKIDHPSSLKKSR